MICKKCGMTLPDGAQFCGACGAVQEVTPAEVPAEAAAPVEAPVETPVETATPVETPVEASAEESAEAPAGFESPDFAAEEPKKKKFKLKFVLLPAIALVTAAAVLLCVFNWAWVQKWWLDMFGKPEDLRNKVISEQTETVANTLSKQYGNSIRTMKDVLNGDKYVSTTVELVVGDTAEDLLVEVLSDSMDDVDGAEALVSKLNGSYITLAGGNTDDMFQMAYKLGIGGQELMSAGVVADMVNQHLYMSIPTLSNYHLDLSESFQMFMEELAEEINQEDVEAIAAANDLLNALPSEEVVNTLLKKYISLAVAEFDDVSKDKVKLNIGGIKEKVTVLETSISEEDLMAACAAVVNEAINDKDIKNIIVDIVDAANAYADTGITSNEVYSYFVEALEEALEDMDDYDPDTEEIAVVTQYLDASYEVVGLAVEVDGEDVLYYATASKGDNFAFEMEVAGEEILSGKGTNKKGIINGTFTVESYGYEVATVKVSNFDKNAFEQGYLKGSFEIVPAEDLMEEILDDADIPYIGAISMMDLSLKIDVNCSENSSSLQVGVAANGEVLVGVKLSSTISDKQVTAPSADKTTDDVEEWINTFKADQLVESLRNLGASEDLLQVLEEAFDMLKDRAYYV